MSRGVTHLIRWIAPMLAVSLGGCGGTLKCDLSEAPGIAVANLGPPAPSSSTPSPRSVQLTVVYSSRLAPSIGTAFDRTSLGGTAIPIAQLDNPYKPLIPTPPVEQLVGKAVEGLLAARNTATVLSERATLSSGVLVDVSRFEMDGGPNERDLFFEARVTVLAGGTPTYDRMITLKRSAHLGTGAGETVGARRVWPVRRLGQRLMLPPKGER
jgi:hypothetical protein